MTDETDEHLEQLAVRLEMGDLLDRPRQIDHFAEFRKKQNAVSAAAELESSGYRIDDVHRGFFRSNVQFSEDSPVDETSVRAFVRKVIDIVEKHDGVYDSWGGDIVEE